MWSGMGDWTTWEGLTNEMDEPSVVFGTKKPASAPKHVPQPASKKAAAASSKPDGFGFKFNSGIGKKKKAPRGAGLMMKAVQAEIVVETEEAMDEDEEMAEPSPYIKSTKNAFSALEGMIEEVEEASEKPAAEKKRVSAAKKAVIAPAAAKKQSVVSMVAEAVEKKGLTPVARRTRRGFSAVSEAMAGVVEAVVKSPFVQRSRSALAEQSATASNLLFGKKAEAAPAKAAAAPAIPALTAKDVKAMTVPKLKEALEARGLDHTGLKATLAARLLTTVEA